MSSGFSSNELNPQLSNYPVSKGDVVGHEFHGNQYASAHGLSEKATKLVDEPLPSGNITPDQPTLGHITGNQKDYYTKMAQAHNELAAGHNIAGMTVGRRNYDTAGSQGSAQRHFDASDAHQKAADLYERMANRTHTLDQPDEHAKMVARGLTLNAAVASQKAAGFHSHLVS